MARKYKGSSWEDFELTRDEVHKLGDAFKKEEFRKLLAEYAEEINDPENRKRYEEEMTELEKERGVDISFINPEPCYVIKSSVNGQKKAFINICKNDKVKKPSSVPMTKSGSPGLNWSLPYTQAPPRDDLDKNGNRCTVFDVVFHSDTHRLAESNAQFKQMLNNIALDAVEDNFDVQLDRNNLKFPKMKYKGCPRPTVIRKKMENFPLVTNEFSVPDSVYPYNFPVEDGEKEPKNIKVSKRNEPGNKSCAPYTTPKYVMKHRQPIDIQNFTNDRDAKMNSTIPKELVIEIELPLLKSSADIILDVTKKSISLVSEKPAKYKLDLLLPYTVDEEAGNAKFDQSLRKLVITLLVKHQSDMHLTDAGRDDSGVESDVGRRTPESGSDDDTGNVINQNSIVEIQSNELMSPEIMNGEAYRTMSTNNNKFLNSDVHYLFPTFTCNVVDNLVAFTLHVKNVEPESIEYCFLSEDFCGVHLQFTSLGSGFFPIHYAFCVKFPSSVSICKESFSAEAWDNNVITQMQLKSCDTNVMEYYAGVDSTSMVKYDLPELAAVVRKLEQLKIDALDSTAENAVNIEVAKFSENEVVVEISPEKTEKKENYAGNEEGNDKDDESETNNAESTVDVASRQHCTNTSIDTEEAAEPVSQFVQTASHKYRSLSESSGIELSFSPTKKGILKNNGRVSRSLSESSADDYAWSSSLDMVTQSGSESCIPEETTEEERETKKTVRFNEVVSQKTYRTNSSILGQRKKNQRKTRNKKRCQERRASESENSEGEAEKERERETKTDDEQGKSKMGSEHKLLSSSSSGESTPSGEGSRDPAEAEEEVASKPSYRDTLLCSAENPSKQSPNKGKRKNRKGAVALQASIAEVCDMEFGSDLIFDLDM
ncbi:hypothetical protein Cfor_07916 [Coptotermes formosanus]|uniref:Protein kintoun n=1 Tax=Coptotermes formosanus TaxID=36987 RepID=A0A6L2PV00_COPFO|nr:hypothetical protein Cfor_07916 [Coptotermes formosanus]